MSDRAGADGATEQSRLRWQCRRGMRELDVLLTEYLEAHYASSCDAEKAAFRRFLSLSDPELVGYLLSGEQPGDPQFAIIIERLRGDDQP